VDAIKVRLEKNGTPVNCAVSSGVGGREVAERRDAAVEYSEIEAGEAGRGVAVTPGKN